MTTEECVICCSSIINRNYNCITCNNSVCNNCYVNLVHRKEDSLNHNCPFCKTKNFKKWTEIDIPVIVNFFEKKEELLVKNIYKLNKITDEKNDEIRRLKAVIEDKNREIKEHIEFIEEQKNIISNTLISSEIKPSSLIKKKMPYRRFYKITYWGLRESNQEMTAQEAMQRVSVLWKEYKLSFS